MKVRLYKTSSGRSPVKEFLQELSPELRRRVDNILELLEAGERLSMPLSRNLARIRPGLHELRLKDENCQIRLFYYMKSGDAIYLLHGFRKKRQKIPQNEVLILLRRLKELD